MIQPYDKLNGESPLFILQFDTEGRIKSPLTAEFVLNEIAAGTYDSIYVFSHGWNNDFGDSLELYRKFFVQYLSLRAKHMANAVHRPVFIGLHWPSIILSLPWESGPRIATASGGDAAEDAFARSRDTIAESVHPARRGRFYELTEGEWLDQEQAGELAEILLPLYRANTWDGEHGAPTVETDGLVAAWKSVPSSTPSSAPDYQLHGRISDEDEEPSAPLRAATWADLLDPRNALRVTTVLVMKDRAGVVGQNGLAPLLARLIAAAGRVPIRLIGHSYGARVCLTALSAPALDDLSINSLLLLQPAVNQYCFAASVPELGILTPGGFVPALSRVRAPIYTTFSSHDIPLRAFFHLAARRPEDRGEIRFAAEGPSVFSALGGYGPAGMPPGDVKQEKIHNPGKRYQLPPGVRVLALDGSAGQIPGHGDVANRYTCWALLDQEMIAPG